jgi:putative transposase
LIDAKINFLSMSSWTAPVVLIPKPEGSIRLCVDYRDLNKLTIADPFPLPRVDEILEAVFSYISPKSQLKLLFVQFRIYTHSFLFKKCSTACVRLMNRQLGDLNFVRAYMDDICVFLSSFNEHIDLLLIVFDRLFLSGIKTNWAYVSSFNIVSHY